MQLCYRRIHDGLPFAERGRCPVGADTPAASMTIRGGARCRFCDAGSSRPLAAGIFAATALLHPISCRGLQPGGAHDFCDDRDGRTC
jgi:hypothetical protein